MNRTAALLLVVASVVAAGCIAGQEAGAADRTTSAADNATTSTGTPEQETTTDRGTTPPEGTTATGTTTTTGPPPTTGTPTTTGPPPSTGTPTTTGTPPSTGTPTTTGTPPSTGTPTTTRATTTTTRRTTRTTTTTRRTTRTTTTTRAPTTTTTRATTTTPDPGGDGLPPGVSGGTLTGPDALFAAHVDSLDGAGYEMQFDARGSGADVAAASVRADGPAVRFSVSGDGTTVATYTGGGATLQRAALSGFDGYSYFGPRVTPPVEGQFLVERSYVRLVLLAGDFEVTGRTTSDGQELVELRASEVLERSPTAGNVTLDSMRATVLVDAQGRIHELTATVTGTASDGGPLDGQLAYSVTPSEGVSAPDWTANVPRVEATLLDDGRVLRLTHRGGPALGGTTVVQVGDVEGALGKGIREGETVYLRATEDGFAATRERPSVGADAPTLDSRVTLTAFTSGPSLRVTVVAEEEDG